MSMISPETYLEQNKDNISYEELLLIRDEIIEIIKDYEKTDWDSSDICPSLSSLYQWMV